MEGVLLLFGLGAALVLIATPILALVAMARTSRLARELQETRADLAVLERRVFHGGGERPPAEPEAEAPSAATVATAGDRRPEPTGTEAAARPVPEEAQPTSPASGPVPSPPPRPPAPSRAPVPRDFATNLGPRLLVGAGALAVVVFLGYFVRYAWENNWVGPAGRVLSGAVFSLGLLAGGLRLMRREYRPLAQGLAAAGLAGLYVTAYAAHGVYGLVPRTAAGSFMLVVTACAVALAERLDARLLATLAWAGGYLTPVLLSTGEDKAESLFAYLLLLGAGAVWLDRRRPWPETLPLALAGSTLLYAGWYESFFRPERFGVAIAGLLLLSALFALGAASKERPAWLAVLAVAAAIGLAALGQDADRPEVVLPTSLLLAGALLRAPGVRLASLVAPLLIALPFLAWTGAHYRPESFGIAAGWVGAGSVLVALASPSAVAPAALMPAIALVGGGLASIALAASSDRPLGILGLLAAQAGLAVLVSRRLAWAAAAGSALAAGAVLAWLDRYFAPDRGTDALALGLAAAALYFLIVTVRGFRGDRLDAAGTVTHLAAAGLAWAVLYRVLDATAPSLLGPAAAALGALHLLVGLAARQRGPGDPLRVRVALGLAAAFLTIAIPVQLGLHGITIGWALEGLLLVWLGVRNRSWHGRAFGYAVLALAVGRLLVRHLPLHPQPFAPVVNPAFGTWLAVILALVAARFVVSAAGERRGDIGVAESTAVHRVLVPLAVILLFALLTAETSAAFAQNARANVAAGDAAGALSVRRQGDVAVSVLWTLFATGLLAAGLGARSRGLFYAAYALFAITAGKVVLFDLDNLPTLLRMIAFLALGVLLLAGAWLNLRFRERLSAPAPEAP